MKTTESNQDIGGIEVCMKIITKATNVFGQLFPNIKSFTYIWFSGVKIVEEAISEGVDYCGTIKTSHKVF